MSTTIDKRVVEMRFDNKQFESNVQTSMSTLDKLKEKLNLSGAAKGLEDINAAAKNVNMSGMGTAVETIRTKFSALEVVAVTALANIANQAINTGKQLVASLTIDPIMDGFREYELTLNAVQTTMAGTGKTAGEVSEELKKLDEYADKTVYSTADMLNNLPKFTNAGVQLEVATKAMIGIANATALAGGDAQKASIAFYNLGQAIGTGYLTRMDYNSINNAGIATMAWKEAMVEAAIAAGTLTKAGDDLYKANGKSFTLQQLFIEGLQEQWATTDVLLKVLGDYGDETTDIGKKAYAAATEIKTFTMMMDSLKASAGTGWKDTWQILFGNLDQAKKFWTGLYNAIAKVIDKMAEWRNNLLNGALNHSGMDALVEKIEKAGYSAEDFNKILINTAKKNGIAIDDLIKKHGSLNEVIKAGKIPANIFTEALQKLLGVGDKATGSANKMKISVEELGKVVNRVINGDFGNGKERIEALTKAGYDYATVQNAVNEKLGISYRHVSELTEAQKANAEQLVKLSDEQLKQKGYTDEQIQALRELEEAAKTSGASIQDLLDNMTRPSGKELIFDTIKHLAGEASKILTAFKDAWKETFNPVTSDDVYNVIEKVHELATSFEISEEAVENFKTIFEGLLAAFQLTNSIVSMSVVGGLKIANAVLELFGTDILGVAANVAELIIKLRDWVEENTFLIGSFDKIGEVIYTVINGVQKVVDAILTLDPVKKLISTIKDKFVEWFGDLETGLKLTGNIEKFNKVLESAFDKMANWIKSLQGLSLSEIIEKIRTSISNFGQDVLDACPPLQQLVSFFKDSIADLKTWFDSFKESEKVTTAFDTITTAFDNVKQRFSEAYEVGKNVIEGLKNGIQDGSMSLGTIIGTVIKGMIKIVETILDINSPSKVFFAIGGFIIAGLVGGLLGNTTSVKEALTTIGNTIIDFFSGIDFETVIAAGIAVGALAVVKKVTDILEDFGKGAKGIGHLADSLATTIDTVNNSVTGKIKPSKWTVISKAIERVAIAISLLVTSLIVLSKIPSAELWPAVGALTAIATIVGLLAMVMATIQNLGGEGDIEAMGNTLIKMSVAMGVMAVVAKVAAGMSVEEMLKGGAALVAFGGIIVGFMAATRLVSSNEHSVSKIGGALLKVAAAMGIMLIVAKVAAGMSVNELLQGGAVLVAFGALMVGFMAATRLVSKSDKSVGKVGGTLFKIAAAMAVMIVVAKVAASMTVEELLKGGAALVAFGGIIVGFMAATNLVVKGSKNVGKIGGALLKMSLAMGVMIVVAKLAASMSLEDMLKGGAALVAFGGIIVGFMAATNLVVKGSKNIEKIGGALLKISLAMGVMIIVAKLAATMSVEDMLKGGAALVAFGGIIVGLMAATQLLTKNSKSIDAAGTALLKMAGAIAILAATAALLSLINPERLLPATAALTMLMGAFALVVAACKTADKVKAAQVGQLAIMLAIVGALAGIVAAISLIPNPDAAIPTATGLSILLTSLSASMVILSKAKGVTTDTITNAMLMSTVVGILGGILLILASFDAQPSIETAVALSVLLTVLSASMLILSKAKGIDPSVLVTVGLMAAIIGGIGLIIGVLEQWDLTTSIATATAMSILLVAVAGALRIVAPLGPTAASAQPAMLLLLEFIGILAGVIIALGLLTQIPHFDKVIRDGGETLALIGYALGKFVGSIIGGFADGALSGLPAIGQYLSDFMTNASVFIEGVKGINESAALGAKNLCTAILALTTAELINGISSLINSETSLASLGLELSAFMMNIMPFLANVSTVKPEMLEGVKALAETILILTAAEVVQGLSSKIFGSEGGLDSFATGLPTLGTALASFVTKLGTFDEGTVTTVTCAANALKALAEASNEIPNEGGWVAKLVGENSLAAFGDQLPALGTALSSFVTNLTANGAFGEDTVATVTCAGNAIKALAEAATSINGQPDWAKTLFGDNSLATFGEQLGGVGKSLSTFVKNLGTFSADQVSTVKSAVEAIKALTGLASADLKGAKKHLTDFGDDLVDFAGQLASFCKDMPSTETVTAATDNIQKILTTVSDIVATKTEAIANFAKSLKNLAKSGVDSFVSELTSEDAKADTIDAGEKLVGGVIDGMEDKEKDLKNAGTTSAEQAVEGVGTQTDDMESAGKDLGSGLVTGINSKKTAAYNAGYALGQAAVRGEKDGQKSNSPSKLTIQAGHWLGDGLVIGMKHMVKKVRDTGYNLGDSATKSISGTIAAIAAGVDTDMDMQPTIRPVVDLSEVRAGANAVGSMFASPSVGVLSNVRAISSAMNRRNQNGANDDVVSAIKDLKKSMPTKAGDTYNFGDLSYEEGSDVGDAVKTIVRAIRVGRRV